MKIYAHKDLEIYRNVHMIQNSYEENSAVDGFLDDVRNLETPFSKMPK